jgi:hypothetical protein
MRFTPPEHKRFAISVSLTTINAIWVRQLA